MTSIKERMNMTLNIFGGSEINQLKSGFYDYESHKQQLLFSYNDCHP